MVREYVHIYVCAHITHEHAHDVILQSRDGERLITKITKIIFQYWLDLAGSDTWAYIEYLAGRFRRQMIWSADHLFTR